MAKIHIDMAADTEEKTAKPNADAGLEAQIIHTLKTVFDPELPVNVYDLGLIYHINIENAPKIHIQMTLTAPNCPVADQIPRDVAAAVEKVDGVTHVDIEMVWTPKWTKDRMSDAAKVELGFF